MNSGSVWSAYVRLTSPASKIVLEYILNELKPKGPLGPFGLIKLSIILLLKTNLVGLSPDKVSNTIPVLSSRKLLSFSINLPFWEFRKTVKLYSSVPKGFFPYPEGKIKTKNTVPSR